MTVRFRASDGRFPERESFALQKQRRRVRSLPSYRHTIFRPESFIRFHRGRVLLFLLHVHCFTPRYYLDCTVAQNAPERMQSFSSFSFFPVLYSIFMLVCVRIIMLNEKQPTGRPFSRFLIIICKTAYCVVPVVNILLLLCMYPEPASCCTL